MNQTNLKILSAFIPLGFTLLAVLIYAGFDYFFIGDRQFKSEQYEDFFQKDWQVFYVVYVFAIIIVGIYTSRQIQKPYRTWVYHGLVASIVMTLVTIIYFTLLELLSKQPFVDVPIIEFFPLIIILMIVHLIIWLFSVHLLSTKKRIRIK